MHTKLKPLTQQTIVITGASSGIGLVTAKEAARRGARVVLAARDEEALLDAEKSIRSEGGEVIHVGADVSRREDVEAVAEAAINAYGGFDSWVNNAGLGIVGKLEDVSEEDHRRLFDVNFWGTVYGSFVALETLKASGGSIINLGSVASDVGLPLQGMYSASKHAIKGFTEALRMELKNGAVPVNVTLIKPASIDTPFSLHSRNYTEGKPTLPAPVYTPEDVAEMILYAAEHGGRDYYVGSGAKFMAALNRTVPLLIDWLGSTYLVKETVRGEKSGHDREGALYLSGMNGHTRGDSPHLVRHSLYARVERHPAFTTGIAAALCLGTAALVARQARR